LSKIVVWWKRMSGGQEELVPGGYLFSRLVYLWFILVFLWLSPVFGDAVGPESLTFRRVYESTLLKNFIYLLNYSSHLWREVMVIHLVSACLCFLNVGGGRLAFGKRLWLINLGVEMMLKVVAWITGMMLLSSTFLLYNAGIYVAGSWLFFLVFYFPKAEANWKVVFNNWAILACRIQFIVVYFYSAAFKWLDMDWRNGDSIHFLSLIEQFTPEWLSSVYQSSTLLTSFLTYAMLAYLTLFPILIWWKKAKGILLTIGIGFHLYTMFIMKLYDFGAIMIIGYVLFLTKEHLDYLKRVLRLKKA